MECGLRRREGVCEGGLRRREGVCEGGVCDELIRYRGGQGQGSNEHTAGR